MKHEIGVTNSTVRSRVIVAKHYFAKTSVDLTIRVGNQELSVALELEEAAALVFAVEKTIEDVKVGADREAWLSTFKRPDWIAIKGVGGVQA